MPRVQIRPPFNDTPPLYIYYETFGKSKNPAILFVEGLGATSASWTTESLIKPLADAGYYCIIYDNRDAGRSSYITYKGDHSPLFIYSTLMYNLACPFESMKINYEPPYVLKDMAEDGILLLDALGIKQAHLVGRSMGGMIAQVMAIFWQSRFLSFCSFASFTGNFPRQLASVYTLGYLYIYLPTTAPKLTDRNNEEELNKLIKHSTIGMTYTQHEPGATQNNGKTPLEEVRRRYEHSKDNLQLTGGGKFRQMAAVLFDPIGQRDKLLKDIKIPSIVIHGKNDVLVPFIGGVDTANALGNCRKTLWIDNMGHEVPDREVKRIFKCLLENITYAHEQLNRCKL
eukprot:g3987.t1